MNNPTLTRPKITYQGRPPLLFGEPVIRVLNNSFTIKGKSGYYRRRRFKCDLCGIIKLINADGEFDEHLSGEYAANETNKNYKNGKEIYEGDVLEYSSDGIHKQPCEVIYVPCTFYARGTGMYQLSSTTKMEYTIIGNIYQDPELIQK